VEFLPDQPDEMGLWPKGYYPPPAGGGGRLAAADYLLSLSSVVTS